MDELKEDEYVSEAQEPMSEEILLNEAKAESYVNSDPIGSSDIARQIQILSEAKTSFERNGELIAESVAALERYWRQIHWYYALIGTGITLLLGGSAFSFYYLKSADRILSQAHVKLSSDPGNQGLRLTLSGRKISASGRSDNQVVVEFLK